MQLHYRFALIAIITLLAGCGGGSISSTFPANSQNRALRTAAVPASAGNATVFIAGGGVLEYPLGATSPTSTLFVPDGPGFVATDTLGHLYVSYQVGQLPAIGVFHQGANGNATPIRQITGAKTQLEDVQGIAVDRSGNLYVSSNYPACGGGQPLPCGHIIEIFSTRANGDVVPTARITYLRNTAINNYGIAVDGKGRIYFDSGSAIYVFAAGSRGNQPPIEVIQGSRTNLIGAFGNPSIAVDGKGVIYAMVSMAGKWGIGEFAPASNGNVAPKRTLINDSTIFDMRYFAVDTFGAIYIMNYHYSGQYSYFAVYAPGASGSSQPIRTLGTPSFGPIAISQ